ncbi:sugar transferase [Amycolatopsis pithecellobii]|uniref:Sugar transferase n=1 Tax=Amycolatopsis pithecellobii TaxID=664692 RepID=A0A6N7YY55_9PSEU|nr:sugar transferase [Amycolatopsis pithecellobii]MTD58027.1 sugar transferase [Amycolatopsis pithecellobii]
MIARARPGSDGRARRTCDVLAASIALIVLTPVLLAVSLLVGWRLGSPILFRQRRAGRFGREFVVLKFRTMRPASYPGEPDSVRETRLGTILRRMSLDELPQLVNILRGDMSVIGPRPTLPEQVRRYDRRQFGRLAVRPGLTGWAQVHGRNLLSWPDRIELDLWYIERRSWHLDAWIVLLTVACLIRPHGVVGQSGVNPDFPEIHRSGDETRPASHR